MVGILKGEPGRIPVASRHHPFQGIPPEFFAGVDMFGADEEGGRYPHLFQDGERFKEIVRITVIEGDGYGGLVEVFPRILKPDDPEIPLEMIHLSPEIVRRDYDRIHIGEPGGYTVITEDNHRTIHGVIHKSLYVAGLRTEQHGRAHYPCHCGFLATIVMIIG
jgi:hypothetical protein